VLAVLARKRRARPTLAVWADTAMFPLLSAATYKPETIILEVAQFFVAAKGGFKTCKKDEYVSR
jgi:hypothetical protein